MDENLIYLNGLNGAGPGYLIDPLNPEDLRSRAPAWTADYPLWVHAPSAQAGPPLPQGWSTWADPTALACRLAGRNPTEAELTAFGFDRDLVAQYREICP